MMTFAKSNLPIAIGLAMTTVLVNVADGAEWRFLSPTHSPSARHEASMVSHQGQLYLLGGRRIHSVDIYHPAANDWSQGAMSPLELHHFQAVSVGDSIYMVGAMNGKFPRERPLEKVVAYRPASDQFELIHHIPESRRRGGAGAAAYQGKIYVVGGITNGHTDGTVAWLDVYDPITGVWEKLADAPHARDHCTAAILGDRLYAIGGRATTRKDLFRQTVADIDVFDLKNQEWIPDAAPPLPTPRAGLMATVVNDRIYVAGGESGDREEAHDEVEVLIPGENRWTCIAKLNQGRHGTGLGFIDGNLYVAAGCGRRGGSPELDSIETIALQSTLPTSEPAPTKMSSHSVEPQLYELRHYIFDAQSDPSAVYDYCSRALLPALNRQGIQPVGLFATADSDETGSKRCVVAIPINNPSHIATLKLSLADDQEYQIAAKTFLDRDASNPAYKRVQSELLMAMHCMPKLQVAADSLANEDRIYELRTYESSNERYGDLKVDMFNSGEVPIFLESKIIPVLIGQTLVGPQMPSLTYLTVYEDENQRAEAWKSFRSNPNWRVLSKDPKYADTVSHIDKYVLRPLTGSQM